MKKITYYAVALNPQGKIAQLLCVRTMGDKPGECISKSQTFTGVTYKSNREAMATTAALNGCKEGC